MYACLAVTCHLHFWQNDRDFLRATVVTRGWNGYRNKSQHRKSTLEKKILPPFQQGFEPATGSDKECIIQASYDFELGCSETSGLPLPHKFNSPDHSKVSKHAHSYNYRRENLYWKCTVWIATAHSVTIAPIGSKLQPNLDVSASENTITHREGLSQNPLDFTSFKTARD